MSDIVEEIVRKFGNCGQSVSQEQVNALYDLYTSTQGLNWRWYATIPGVPWNFTNYDPYSASPTTDPCGDDWEGVFCNCTVVTPVTCDITELNLTHHNLVGTLPSTISQLTYLASMNLGYNQITDSIPASIGSLTGLKLLSFNTNLLVGSIPSNLSSLHQLVLFDVGFNNLTSSIPSDLFDNMDLLETFIANNNLLRGTIPANISRLTKLVFFNVYDNFLDGTLPSLLNSRDTLLNLDVSFNDLEGTFPAFLFNMTSLAAIDISRNFFEGPLPDNFTSDLVLDTLKIGYNFFHGPLPRSLATVTTLTAIELDRNLLDGSLPDWLGLLSNMRFFTASNNSFTSTLPASLSQWSQLDTFRMLNNMLHGHANESFVNMSSMLSLELSNNMFSGSLPGSSQQWMFLQDYSVFLNKFSGTLSESFGVYSRNTLVSLNVNDNLLEGTISDVYNDMPVISFFTIANNRFSGPLPSFFATPSMSILVAANNEFTGTISPFIGQLQELSWFNVSYNRLKGSIPQSFGSVQLLQLTEVDLTDNLLTGTLPPYLSQLPALQILYLARNKFSGNLNMLVNSSVQKSLLDIDVSHNEFTGSIPSEAFRLEKLNIFAAATNCLSGTIPDVICSALDLRTLVLDGVSTAHKCRQYISPFNSAFVLTKALRGTIPACLFSMHRLVSLRLSSNYLTGTLPDNYTLAMLNFSVSHNFIHGTIPYGLQRKPMTNLDLSYNRFTGYLTQDFAHIPPRGSLFLQVNRLSGIVPGPIQDAEDISILDGNIFSCDYDRTELPSNDPDRDTYVCASHSLDMSTMIWGVFVGVILFGILGYLMAFHISRAEKNYGAISVVKAAIKNARDLNEYIYATIAASSATNTSIRNMHGVFNHSRRLALALTAYSVLLLMPLYVVLTSNLYTNSYGWTLSAVLVAGPTATTALSVFFAISILILLLYVWRMNAEFEASDADESLSKSSRVVVQYAHKTLLIVILFIINGVVMLGADIVYVVVALNSKRGLVLLGEIAMAIFKLAWNETMLWRLIPLIKSALDSQDDNAASGSDSHHSAEGPSDSSPTSTPPVSPRSDVESPRATTATPPNPRKFSLFAFISLNDVSYDSADVPLISSLSQFNNIVIPALAIVCVSSDCFLTAIFPTSTVQDSYFTSSCLILAVDRDTGNGVCLDRVFAPRYVSYNPPFIYSYMCASSIVINYTPVYVFLFTICGVVIPTAKIIIRRAMHATGDNWLKRLLWKYMSALYLPVVPITDLLPTQSKRVFSKEKITVRLISTLGVLVAYGTVYPPLAFIACFSVYSFTYTEHLLQSLCLQEADARGLSWYREQLGEDARGIGRLFISTLYFIIPYAALVFGYLIFDTLGYTNGWKSGIIVAVIVTICWPIAVRLARLIYLIASKDESVPESTNFSIVSSVIFVLGGSNTVGTTGRASTAGGNNSFVVQNPMRNTLTEDSSRSSANTIPNLRLSALAKHNGESKFQAEDRGSVVSSLSFFSSRSAGLRGSRFQYNANESDDL
eukprot:gene27828-33606_t